ncbi:unnamed protein product [Discula destructiva]
MTPKSTGPVSTEQTEDEKSKAAQVKEVFEIAWNGYYEFAFPNDELLPVSNSSSNPFQGWAMTMVDALTTAAVMESTDIVSKSLDYIPTIDYTRGLDDSSCSLFETNIRHVGGLLGAYDILSGPLANVAGGRADDVKALLTQAQSVADTLKYAFDTPTGIPYNGLFINNRTTDGGVINNIAQIGTLVLEWTRLSDLTGNPEYAGLVEKAESYLLAPQNPELGEPFPGLIGQVLNITTGNFTSGFGGWIGGVDSYYEYLLKMYVYDPQRFASYKDAWIEAAESTVTYLISNPTSKPELTFLAVHDNTTVLAISNYLAGFAGGNFILAGLVLREPRYLDYGLRLAEGVEAQYNGTLTKLGPGRVAWDPVDTSQKTNQPVPAEETAFYEQNGYWIRDGSYALTPEVVESFYYAYRATGDRKYQDYVWSAFVAMRDVTRVGSGYSAISDVDAPNGGEFLDAMPSFALAETMKYMYLTFAPQSPVFVGGGEGLEGQEWVFNTECHPLRVYVGSNSTGVDGLRRY